MIALWTFALAADSGQAAMTKCSKEGSVTVQIENRTFNIPRLVLRRVGAVGNEPEKAYYCNGPASVRAASIFINVTVTWSGQKFYNEWFGEKRLPPSIEINLRKTRRSYVLDRLEAAKASGYKDDPSLDYDGFRATETSAAIFFDGDSAGLRGHDGRGIVFSCTKERIPRGGRHCQTSYPYDDLIAIRYSFYDNNFPVQEWAGLDARVRDYISGLMKRN